MAGPPGAGIEGSVLKSRCRRQRRLRAWFVGVAVTAGVVLQIPAGSGCGRRDALAAVEAAKAASWPWSPGPRRGWMNALWA